MRGSKEFNFADDIMPVLFLVVLFLVIVLFAGPVTIWDLI